MPVAVHVGDPIWCYLHPEDNDGYPNSERWRIDTTIGSGCAGIVGGSSRIEGK